MKLQIHHVLARLAKRTQRCDDRRAVFPGEQSATGKCPGWHVVDLASGRGAKIVACAECNALLPARLRVEDADVRLLIAAREAQRRREMELHLARRARGTTTHLRESVASMRVLCGHDLGRTPGGRRSHQWTYDFAQTTCAECRRLGQLTPAQRAAETLSRAQTRQGRFAAKRAEEVARRDAERAQRAAMIAESRPEAMVALDVVEAGGPVDSDQWALVDRALRAAIVAYKHDHPKSRGERLWVLRDVQAGTGHQHCRFCDACLRDGVTVGSDSKIAGSDAEVAAHTTRCALRYLAAEYLPPAGPIAELTEEVTA